MSAKTTKQSLSFICAALLLFFACQSAMATRPHADDLVWASLRPTIELFWKENQDSPYQAKQDAWEIISSLKDFIHTYPDSSHVAEAYYILGEAYAAVSYFPEAIAHWRIVTRDFPTTPWASQALTAIVLELEKRGESGRLKGFYKEIIKEYPDSPAAKAAWVSLAIDALSRGQQELVARYVNQLESSDPEIHVTVPRFLDLKARLLSAQGQEAKARESWLQYLNLTQNREEKAGALFRIAESFRRQRMFQRARKYYSILKLDYRNLPEALFARFRLYQMDQRFRSFKSVHYAAKMKGESDRILLDEIIKKYPTHPLTQEVEYEAIYHRFKQGKYVEVLQKCAKFLDRMHNAPFAERVLKLAKSAKQALLAGNYTSKGLKGIVEGLSKAEQSINNAQMKKLCLAAKEELWNRYIRRLAAKGKHGEVLAEIWRFAKEFTSSIHMEKLLELGQASLLNLDRKSLNNGRLLELLNFHYQHQKSIVRYSNNPEHYLYLGRAWEGLKCPEAAQRAYFRGLSLSPSKDLREKILFRLAGAALQGNEIKGAQGALSLLPENSLEREEGLYLKARINFDKAKYESSFEQARKGLDLTQGNSELNKKFFRLYFESALKLGNWQLAIDLLLQREQQLPKKELSNLFRRLGDEAFRLGYVEASYEAYYNLFSIEPDDETASMRLALGALNTGRGDTGQLQLQALTQASDPLLKKAAAQLLENQKFWQGEAKRFKKVVGGKM